MNHAAVYDTVRSSVLFSGGTNHKTCDQGALIRRESDPLSKMCPLSGSRIPRIRVGPAPVIFVFPAARNANVEKCRQKGGGGRGGAVNCHLPRKQC